jgi:hypothetical protein
LRKTTIKTMRRFFCAKSQYQRADTPVRPYAEVCIFKAFNDDEIDVRSAARWNVERVGR